MNWSRWEGTIMSYLHWSSTICLHHIWTRCLSALYAVTLTWLRPLDIVAPVQNMCVMLFSYGLLSQRLSAVQWKPFQEGSWLCGVECCVVLGRTIFVSALSAGRWSWRCLACIPPMAAKRECVCTSIKKKSDTFHTQIMTWFNVQMFDRILLYFRKGGK